MAVAVAGVPTGETVVLEEADELPHKEVAVERPVGKMLDDAGFKDCKICGTNALDEFLITLLSISSKSILA